MREGKEGWMVGLEGKREVLTLFKKYDLNSGEGVSSCLALGNKSLKLESEEHVYCTGLLGQLWNIGLPSNIKQFK